MRKKLRRQRAMPNRWGLFAWHAAHIDARPDEAIPFLANDPGPRSIKPETPFNVRRNFNCGFWVNWSAVCDRQNADPSLPRLLRYREHKNTGPVLASFFTPGFCFRGPHIAEIQHPAESGRPDHDRSSSAFKYSRPGSILACAISSSSLSVKSSTRNTSMSRASNR